MAEEKKKKMYYSGKEKKAGEIKKVEPIPSEEWVEPRYMPYWSREAQMQFEKMMEGFEKEFEDFWEMPPFYKHEHARHRFPLAPFRETKSPSIDLEDRGKDYRLTVDLPGFSKNDIEVEVQDDSVMIRAQKARAEEEKKKNYVRRERVAQAFFRRMQLPEMVKSEQANANLNNGILEITLPKKSPKETKKLTIV